jgi:Septin
VYFVYFIQDRVPFAVVGSNMVMESQGRRLRGRKYPWGIVEGIFCRHSRPIVPVPEFIRLFR